MNQFIDLDKIIKDKSPGAYKWMPGFLIRYLKRVIHQDRLNAFQGRAQHLKGLDYCAATIEELNVNIATSGLHHIPSQGGFILASNHPLGGIDGIALIHVIGKLRADVRFLVNDLLTRLQGFGEIFVPVNKVGSTSMDNLRRIETEFASDRAILIFPAGLVSRKLKTGIKDLAWNKSFVVKTIKYQRPLIPVYIGGQLSSWFYGLSKVRKALGIKANIEMLYLADEMFALEGTQLNITIGKAIPYQTFDLTRTTLEWAQCLRDFVYTLQYNHDADFGDFNAQWQQQAAAIVE
jgi:1-acyl-sn-glycerol-3-phosphate acyltransferase